MMIFSKKKIIKITVYYYEDASSIPDYPEVATFDLPGDIKDFIDYVNMAYENNKGAVRIEQYDHDVALSRLKRS